MVTRRRFLLRIGSGMAGTAALRSAHGHSAPMAMAPLAGGTLAPGRVPKFVLPLVIPPAMPRAGGRSTNDDHGAVDHEIAARRIAQRVLPPEWPLTAGFAYGSRLHADSFSFPSHTIEARADSPLRVRWINELVDRDGHYLPHLLPIDPTLHWANPGGGIDGRDTMPMFTGGTPGPYTGPVPLVTHLHGGHTQPDSDGFPTVWTLPRADDIPPGYAMTGTLWRAHREQFERRTGLEWPVGSTICQYENTQRAAGLWFHDHALGMTRNNIYAGLSGQYLLRGGPGDIVLDASSGGAAVLPGPAPMPDDAPGPRDAHRYHEIALTIQDRSFNTDGSLFFPASRAFFDGFAGPYVGDATMRSDIAPIWNPEFFGNMMTVNGRTWPYLEVEPQRYRFRILNSSNARTLILTLSNEQRFWQIGADGGFLPVPVATERLLLAVAERADVIVDFSGLDVGTRIRLLNVGPDEPFNGSGQAPADRHSTGQVMEFRIVAANAADPSTPIERLLLPAPTEIPAAASLRRVSLNEVESQWVFANPADPATAIGPLAALLGTVGFDAASGQPLGLTRRWHDDVTETPQSGSTELWEIYNFTEDAHPIHVHQVQFQIVEREVFNPTAGAAGTRHGPTPGETGRKDVVIAYPGQITRIRIHFDIPGLYVWHCHIADHEDNEMMRPLLVRA